MRRSCVIDIKSAFLSLEIEYVFILYLCYNKLILKLHHHHFIGNFDVKILIFIIYFKIAKKVIIFLFMQKPEIKGSIYVDKAAYEIMYKLLYFMSLKLY